MKDNKIIQDEQYGIWLIKNLENNNETYSLVNQNANPCYGKTIDEIVALEYVAKNTKNVWNVIENMIGVDSISRFNAELICESSDRQMLLKTKKHLNKSK